MLAADIVVDDNTFRDKNDDDDDCDDDDDDDGGNDDAGHDNVAAGVAAAESVALDSARAWQQPVSMCHVARDPVALRCSRLSHF